MKYIKGFDSLRAISITFVILAHLGLEKMLPDSSFIQERVWPLISGTTGVQIFFTLSGFLITRILLIEVKQFGRINLRNFYIRRFLRLLPPLIVFYTAVAILMKFGQIHTTSKGLLFSVFYLYNFVPNMYYTGEMGHTWSLALEEQYYLLWPFVVNFLRPKRIYLIIALIVASCVAAVYVYPQLSFTQHFRSSRWFIPAVAPVIIGSCFSVMIHEASEKWEAMTQHNFRMLLGGFILFLSPLYMPVLELTFLFQSTGIALILTYILYNQGSGLTRVLENKPMSYIGKISYGLYVYQGLFLRTGPTDNANWFQQFPQNILLTVATAVLSYHLLEKPILNFKKRFNRTLKKG